ncbi:MAG: hypothetical protein Q8O13_07990 [Candidatus Omnitrophota bacterium]|nr:hypothetical protein [Candidatus Omnitrophota bacterium]
MAAKNFSKKEAISHGIKITKKYFGVILSIFLIYAAFQIIPGLLNYGAGPPISKKDIKTLYRESAAADNFYRYLEETGYIGEYGRVQDKLQNITNASDLILPDNLEVDRDIIFKFLNQHRYRLPFPKVIFYLLSIALWIVGIIIQIGLLKIGLLLSRDQKPVVWELFSNGSLFVKFILGYICYGLAVMGGFILLIIPGIILMIMLGMYGYLIVDKNMGPIESLKASRALTKGVRWQLFCFGALLLLLNLAGLLCLVVGLFFTIPASSIAMAYVYDQLRKQDEITAV